MSDQTPSTTPIITNPLTPPPSGDTQIPPTQPVTPSTPTAPSTPVAPVAPVTPAAPPSGGSWNVQPGSTEAPAVSGGTGAGSGGGVNVPISAQ